MQYNTNNKWEKIYEGFRLYFPTLEAGARDWWPAGFNKIAIVLDDYTRIIYDDSDNTIRNVGSLISGSDIDKERWKSEFIKRLRSAMLDNNCDQEKLSRLIGVSQGTVSNYISGKSIPDIYTTYRISEVLNTPIESFMYFD